MRPVWLPLKTSAGCDCRSAPRLRNGERWLYPHSARVDFLDGAIEVVEIIGVANKLHGKRSEPVSRMRFEAADLMSAPEWVQQLVDQAAEQMLAQARRLLILDGEIKGDGDAPA